MLFVDSAVRRMTSTKDFVIGTATRLLAIVVGIGLAVTEGELGNVAPIVAALLVMTFITGATTLLDQSALRRAALLGEACVAPFMILSSPESTALLLPYFYGPAVSSAIVGFGFMAITLGALSLSTLLASVAWPGVVASSRLEVLAWLVQVAGVGILSAWLQHFRSGPGSPGEQADVLAARGILKDLRNVSRRLPGTLDVARVSEQILQHVQRVVPLTTGQVLVGDEASQAYAEWSDDERASGSLFLPLLVRDRLVGVVNGELAQGPWGASPSREALNVEAGDLAALAARLELALLFDDVRHDATGDERRRLAREIHDGIAQELVSIGYALEYIGHESNDVHTATSLNRLREQVSQLLGDIRLSIYDLRHEVSPNRSLGTALTEHLRHVNTNASLTITLSLTDAANRLTILQETELLRIAQEAVSNVRRHAEATNLWVTCWIDDDSAYLQIRDDGVGLNGGTSGGFGVIGMRERAHRIGAEFSVSEHPRGGTVVEVHLERLPLEDNADLNSLAAVL